MAILLLRRLCVFVMVACCATMMVLWHTTAMVHRVESQGRDKVALGDGSHRSVQRKMVKTDDQHTSPQSNPTQSSNQRQFTLEHSKLDRDHHQNTSQKSGSTRADQQIRLEQIRKFIMDANQHIPQPSRLIEGKQRHVRPKAIAHLSKDIEQSGQAENAILDTNISFRSDHVGMHVEQLTECPQRYTVNRNRLASYGKIRQEGQTPPKDNRTDYSILILTPISNSADKLLTYFTLLCSLTYPRHRISVGIGEDSSQDGTYEALSRMVREVRVAFKDVTVYKLAARESNWTREQRHLRNRQYRRRRHLAMARNDLLMRAMREEYDVVVWLDSDVTYYPPDVIQLLLSPRESIVAPVCLMRVPGYGSYNIFDRNTWRETDQSLRYVDSMTKRDPGFLMLEGYGPSKRLYLTDLRQEGAVVPVDSVGGCMLLVNATHHRHGLIFPPFIFDSHIETEGLGKMATRIGIRMYGMPLVSVIHE